MNNFFGSPLFAAADGSSIENILGLPILASQHGADVDRLIFYVHLLMGALFLGWITYFLYVILRFRKSKNPKASYTGVTSHASSWIEGAVVLVEAVLLIGFAVPLWAKVVGDFPRESESTVIRVTAEQFSWGARYPGADGVFGKQDIKLVSGANPFGVDPADPHSKDDITSEPNKIVVPVNKPVIAYITSKDVVHSFKVNPFRITQDAIPGLSLPTWFKPTREGLFMINCAQLCGNSHFFMKGFVKVVSQEEYAKFLADKSKAPAGPASFE